MNVIKQTQKNKKLVFIFVFFISISLTILLLPQFAHAGPLAWITDPLGSIKAAFCSILDGMSEMMLRVGLAILALSLTVTETLIKSATQGANSASFDASVTDVRNFAFGMMAIILIVISFSQVLNISKDKFGAKALLPKMFLASILMLFSTLICYVVYDVGSIMATSLVGNDISAVVYQGATGKDNAADVLGPFEVILGDDSNGIKNESNGNNENIMLHFAFMFVAFIGAIAYIILGIIMIFRSWAVMLFIVLAPLAFASLVLPWTSSWHKKWWAEYAKWVFFLPVSLLILKIGGSIIATYNDSISNLFGANGTLNAIVGATIAPLLESLFMVIGSIITVVAAIFMPLKMLGKIGSEIQRISKGYAGRKTGVTPYLQARTTEQKRVAGEKAQKRLEKVSRLIPGESSASNFFRGAVTGMSKETALVREQERQKKLGNLNLTAKARKSLIETGSMDNYIEEARVKMGLPGAPLTDDAPQMQELFKQKAALKAISSDPKDIQQLARTDLLRDRDALKSRQFGISYVAEVTHGTGHPREFQLRPNASVNELRAAKQIVEHVRNGSRSASELTETMTADQWKDYEKSCQLLHLNGGIEENGVHVDLAPNQMFTPEMSRKLTKYAKENRLGDGDDIIRKLAAASDHGLPPATGFTPGASGGVGGTASTPNRPATAADTGTPRPDYNAPLPDDEHPPSTEEFRRFK
ncbi:MAG: hypothetical protein WC437_02590 [Patescibacteria group bacterium]|jgi:hypothetical protein|nr:hypothetical protein [Patescibacteria group bacterium]